MAQQHKDARLKQLRPGHFLYWQERYYRVLPGDGQDPLTLYVEDMNTFEQQAIRVEALLVSQEEEPIFAPTPAALQVELDRRYPPPLPVNWEALPTHLQQKADQIIAVVETVERLVAAEKGRMLLRQEKFRRTRAVRRACTQLDEPVSKTTYYKYRALYQRYQGDRAAIAAALHRRTFNQTKLSQAQLHFIDIHIMRFYARSQSIRPRPMTLYKIACSTFKRTNGLWLDPGRCPGQIPEDLIEELLDPNLPMAAILNNPEKANQLRPIKLPSRSWFYQYLRWFEHQPEYGKTIMAVRHGPEMWEREHLVFDTFVSRATLPLQYVFADHWLIDVFTVDEMTRSQIDRLWLTLLIDAYSRSILGMALLYETPCIESIQLALRHAIWPKTSHTALGVAGEWVCYGIPLQLSLDNAWAHHAYSLRNLARVISQGGHYNSIDLIFRPPYKGRYGALIERLFGNLSGQMKELLPGAIRSGEPKALRHAAKEACLLYQDLHYLIHQMIMTYQHTPHSELGQMTPHQKWLEGIQFAPLVVPSLTPAMERLFWRTYPETRTISGKGISLFGMHYWSPELSGIQRRGQEGKLIPYTVSYEPADMSRLALFRNDVWVCDVWAKELRLSDGSTQAVSLWEHRIAKILARAKGHSSSDWLSYIHEIEMMTKSRLAEQKKGQRLAKGQTFANNGVGQSDPFSRDRRMSEIKPQQIEAALEQFRLTGQQPDYTDLLVDFVEPDRPGRLSPSSRGGKSHG